MRRAFSASHAGKSSSEAASVGCSVAEIKLWLCTKQKENTLTCRIESDGEGFFLFAPKWSKIESGRLYAVLRPIRMRLKDTSALYWTKRRIAHDVIFDAFWPEWHWHANYCLRSTKNMLVNVYVTSVVKTSFEIAIHSSSSNLLLLHLSRGELSVLHLHCSMMRRTCKSELDGVDKRCFQ